MAVALPFLVAGAVGLATQVAGKSFFKPKAQAAPQVAPQIQRRQNSAVSDAIAARRGASANRRTGLGGAESSAGGLKSKLGT